MRWFFLSVGWASLAFGIAGIFLPLLPTTPFLLLAAVCFSKGSPRVHAWLINHPRLGPIIKDWREKRSIPLRAKIGATILLLPSAILLFGEKPLFVKITIAIVIFGVMLFLWTRKTAA